MIPLRCFVLACSLSAAACGGEADDAVGTSAAELWTVGAVKPANASQTWAGAIISPGALSGWQRVDCLAFGYAANATKAYLLSGLTAWRERSSNLDNFVARLEVRCSEYGDNGNGAFLQTGAQSKTALLCSGGYRDVSGATLAPANDPPIGLRVSLNPDGSYVKDVAILHGEELHSYLTGHAYLGGYNGTFAAGWALDYSSHATTHDILCPDQQVMTGISVKDDIHNRKIGVIRIDCLEVGDL